MANVLIDENTMTEIADAIRSKTGESESMLPAEMPGKISEMQGDNNTLAKLIDRSITEIEFPEGVTTIGDYAFTGCSNLALTSLPETVTAIQSYAFMSCSSLALTVLPKGLTIIGTQGFNNCTSLAITTLPERLATLSAYAFNSCSGLKEITFKGTPTTIAATAFNNCKKITDIYVPWAEGAVADAPWGAINATIHYEYTED